MPLRISSLLIAFWLGLTGAKAGSVVSGELTIIDGDSIELAGERFQLYGIDAPEPGEVCEKTNGRTIDCGRISRSALLDLTAGSEVVCEAVGAASEKAQPANCTADGFSLNRNMIYTGWALVDRNVTSDFIDVETEAKQKKHGLWRYSFEGPPWPESDD